MNKEKSFNAKPLEQMLKDQYKGLGDWKDKLIKLFRFVANNTQESVSTVDLQNQLHEIDLLIDVADQMEREEIN